MYLIYLNLLKGRGAVRRTGGPPVPPAGPRQDLSRCLKGQG